MKTTDTLKMLSLADPESASKVTRMHFLQLAGGLAGLGFLVGSCNKSDNNDSSNGGVNLGSGDVGVLNYAFALEQLEAAFYTQVIAHQYSGITSDEVALLTDVRDHEVAHREFFRAALGANAIQDLSVNFGAIDFSSRDSVLTTAKTFEDLGVSAYNGAGRLIQSPDYLVVAGKIVSVEARHAAYIRDLLSYNSFSDSTAVDGNGLDGAKSPSIVLGMASAFLSTKLDASNLPNF